MSRLLLAVLLLVLAGCATGEPTGGAASSAAAPAPSGSPSESPSSSTAVLPGFDQELHDELLAMLERDQSGRTGGADPEGDAARTARLAEILDAHGWPTWELVGEDGSEAAWAIAQHSDLDPAFQQRALELLRQAVAAGQASAGDLAYLTDRVAANTGQPQTYGTQVACTPDGPQPALPLADPAAVEQLRADAGLPPYADYLDEMAAICAEE
ncbi:DUF6624 domain-containing protein [Geodermatophilus normandii]|uniref:Lipoprotein n=1 Tax=Geodermatophilus normandii TaxID=1137989 RepID=A0A6P0GKQ7_9ACTN|nr:DUF6624 domain-containing protein [Geodermatophilus normandii]NEM07963.1 hypothetical protein [Geodermatophilus normandii]